MKKLPLKKQAFVIKYDIGFIMLELLWTLLKLLLSCVILGLAGLLLFHKAGNIFDAPETLFITAVLFFLAVLPWQTARSAIGVRGTALIPLCMSVCFILLASDSYHGKEHFPHECNGRRTALCHLINWIHDTMGDRALMVVYASASAICLYYAFKIFSIKKQATFN